MCGNCPVGYSQLSTHHAGPVPEAPATPFGSTTVGTASSREPPFALTNAVCVQGKTKLYWSSARSMARVRSLSCQRGLGPAWSKMSCRSRSRASLRHGAA